MLINECFSHHRSYLLNHLSDEWHNFAHLNPLGNDVKTEVTNGHWPFGNYPFKCLRSKLNTCRDQRTIKPCPPCFVNLFFKTEPALHALSSNIQKRYLEKFKLAICFGLATFFMLCHNFWGFDGNLVEWWRGSLPTRSRGRTSGILVSACLARYKNHLEIFQIKYELEMAGVFLDEE